MPEKEQIVWLKKSTAEKILEKKNQSSKIRLKNNQTQNQPNYYVRTEIVKIVEEIKDEGDENSANGYYKVKIARWDDSEDLQKDHEWLYGEGFEVIAYEMGGTTGLTPESGAFVARGMTSSTGQTNWTFRAGGGGASIVWVEIVSGSGRLYDVNLLNNGVDLVVEGEGEFQLKLTDTPVIDLVAGDILNCSVEDTEDGQFYVPFNQIFLR